MTRYDAIRIANEAQLCQSIWIDEAGDETVESVIRFAKQIAAAEREACAKVIEQSRAYQLVWYPEGYTVSANKIDSFYEFQWKRSMDAIRARGQQ